MKTRSDKAERPISNSINDIPRLRRWIQIGACLIGLFSVGTLVNILLSPAPQKPSPEPQEEEPIAPQKSTTTGTLPSATQANVATERHNSATRAAQPTHTSSLPPPTPALRQLVGNL